MLHCGPWTIKIIYSIHEISFRLSPTVLLMRVFPNYRCIRQDQVHVKVSEVPHQKQRKQSLLLRCSRKSWRHGSIARSNIFSCVPKLPYSRKLSTGKVGKHLEKSASPREAGEASPCSSVQITGVASFVILPQKGT